MLAAAALTTPTFLLAWAIAAAAAALVFRHATKRGSRHATAWGLSVFFVLGLALPIYLVHGRMHKPTGRRY
jgi:crotonobetainyl-CoA:carnitine CoA-transferase CaiB-like acyl-CoA transferase